MTFTDQDLSNFDPLALPAPSLAPVVPLVPPPQPRAKTPRKPAKASPSRPPDPPPAEPLPPEPPEYERAPGPIAPAYVPPAARPLPHSLEAEENLLSSCFIDGSDVIQRCLDAGIGKDSFYDANHGTVFACLVDLQRRGLPTEAANIAEELKRTKQLDQVGGYAFIAQVSSRIPTTAQAGYFIKTVREYALRREIIRVAQLAMESANDTAGSAPQEIAESCQARLGELALAVAGESGARAFTLWPPSKFAEYVSDPAACLLGAGYLARGVWTTLLGVGGLGKTRLALWLLVCQMLGRYWCEIPTNGAPQIAVIFSTENGIRRWKDDLAKIIESLTEAERAVVEGHLLILAMTDEEEGDLCLGSPGVVARLTTTLRGAKPGIVVFDPLADMVEGDENKAVDLGATLRKLRAVIRSACPSAAVLIIHHARTGAGNVAQAGDNFNAGNFGRGSKALYSFVRCELQLAPADREDPNRLVLACGKSNDAPKFEPRCLVFDPATSSYSVDPDFDISAWRDDVNGVRKQLQVSIRDVVEAVREHAPAAGDETTTAQVIESLGDSGASARTIQRQIKAAVKAQYLRTGSKRGRWKLGAVPIPKK
jgi:hypothetical protein